MAGGITPDKVDASRPGVRSKPRSKRLYATLSIGPGNLGENVNRRRVVAAGSVFVLLALSFSVASVPGGRAAAPPSFSFAIAGDFPAFAGFSAALAQLPNTSAQFALALGDLGYGLTNESNWCTKFHRHIADVEIIAGSRDTGEPPATPLNWNTMTGDCPYTLASPAIGVYGKQYYFDYPNANPLARFILISPDIRYYNDPGQPLYNYSLGTAYYNWTADAIDGARALGIPWVFVGMAKDCVSGGEHPCEITTDLFNLFLEKKVDLILQAHSHNYQRSKGLALGSQCAGIVNGTYNATCVREDGANGTYQQGSGSVVVISGTGGRDIEPFNQSGVYAPYFAAWMGNNSQSPSAASPPTIYAAGFTGFTVSATQVTMRTYFNTSYQDSFTMNGLPRNTTGSGTTAPAGSRITTTLLASLAGAAVLGLGLIAYTAVRSRNPRKESEPAPEDDNDMDNL